jgi:hypothetical protein
MFFIMIERFKHRDAKRCIGASAITVAAPRRG